MAAYCSLCEDIGRGKFQKEFYRIWSVWKKESTLMYWYVVLMDIAYRKLVDTELDENQYDEVMDSLTNKAIDIRTLPNYTDLSGGEILFNRKDTVVPLIKEAVRKGYIVPLT